MTLIKETKLSFQALPDQTCLIKFNYDYDVTVISKYVDSDIPAERKTISVMVIRDHYTPPSLLPKGYRKEINHFTRSLRIWLRHAIKYQSRSANEIIAAKKVLEIIDDLYTTYVMDTYNSLNVAQFSADINLRILEIQLYLQLNQLEATCSH